MKISKIILPEHENSQGELIAIEELKDIPFRIRRVYYMYGMGTEATRGFHAHKNLQQILICVVGSCKIRLDDGNESKVILLDKPNEGLYMSGTVWREMTEFSPGTVLLVLASEPYNEPDYIRSYNEFLKYVNDNGEVESDE